MEPSRPQPTTLAAFAAVVLIGGSNIVAVRFTNRELDPLWGAAIRFAAASLLLLGIVRLKGLPLPRGRTLALTFAYGLLSFTAAYAFAYWALVDLPAGIVGVMLALVPLVTLFLALAHGLEPFRLRGLVGGLLAVAGVAVMVAEPPGGPVPVAAVLAAAALVVCAAESGILVKKIPGSHPVTTNAVGMAVGAIPLFALSAVTSETWAMPSKASTWATLAYLVVGGSTLLFFLFVYVLQRWTASAASYQFVLFPLVAVTLGAMLLDEPITWSVLLGTPLALAGVYVGALAPGRVPAEAAVDRGPEAAVAVDPGRAEPKG